LIERSGFNSEDSNVVTPSEVAATYAKILAGPAVGFHPLHRYVGMVCRVVVKIE
jgi:hypothetical protein